MSAATPKKPGRKATGKTRINVSITIPPLLKQEAAKIATRKGESLSQYVSRAIQTAIMNGQ